METQRRVRVGIIGCGIGIFHLEGFEKEPRAEIVALAGLDTDRCVMLQQRFSVPRRYGDYKDLLADPDIEAVTIAVPNFLHEEVTLAALAAGKHVLVEKPLARNVAEGERMVTAARKSGKVFGVIFNRRSRHDVQLVKHEVARGALGRIYHGRAFWMRRSGIPGLGSWFTNKELAGGGPLIDLGIHVLDMALWIMGEPEPTAVSAATYAALGPKGRGMWQGARFKAAPDAAYEVEDFATAMIRFANGMTLTLDTSWAGYTSHTDEFGVSFMGDEGGAEIHVKDYADTGTLRFFSEIDGAPTVIEPRLQSIHNHGEVFRRFIDSILTGVPFSPTGEEGLERVRLIEAIYRSAAEGREIALAAQPIDRTGPRTELAARSAAENSREGTL
ncbi:MAG: Gfo/Idh/MocA family oxidoreductase [Thermomicrobiales bacterium]|nr:Gfo/Idh/MocA family oxidoreductase [Thermomicrobiales bacterium]